MNKLIKYCILLVFIILGSISFSNFKNIYEGYKNSATNYADTVNNGVAGTTKTTKSQYSTNIGAYGSNGIATNGYDSNGNAILDFDADNNPIIGYNNGKPVKGSLSPTSSSSTTKQLPPITGTIGYNGDGTPIYTYGKDSNGNYIIGYNPDGSPITSTSKITTNNSNNTDSSWIPPPGCIVRNGTVCKKNNIGLCTDQYGISCDTACCASSPASATTSTTPVTTTTSSPVTTTTSSPVKTTTSSPVTTTTSSPPLTTSITPATTSTTPLTTSITPATTSTPTTGTIIPNATKSYSF
jgi:hypothetical protein